MSYFPFFMDISEENCIVVGGGTIALRKIEVLVQFDAKITVIAPCICDDIYKIQEVSQSLILVKRNFTDQDITHAGLVVAATDDEQLNTHISDLCRKNKIRVNVVDVKEECSFVFPAIVKQENLVIAISTGGNSPAFAAKIKKDIEAVIPEYYGELIEFLGEYREEIKEKIHLPKNRMQAYNELVELGKNQRGNMNQAMVQKVIDKYRT